MGAVSSCRNVSLSSTFHNQSSTDFQDSVGEAVLALARVTSGGVLVFLPSYSLLERLMERWADIGFLREFDREESYTATYRGTRIFKEPRNSTDLEEELSSYYATVDEGQKQAILFAVCRGKVSEGIDFSDDYARTVVVVGIPFANVSSLQVVLKRQFQDNKKQSDDTGQALSGEQWYCQQAYRAVNQAVGRCIRHINDFGAIILCDPRFHLKQTQQELSRWMRSSVKNHTGIEDVILPLRMFFMENQDRFRNHLSALREEKARQSAQALSAHSEMTHRENLRRERRKRKGRGRRVQGSATLDTEEDACHHRQTTLAQAFLKHASKPIKVEPPCALSRPESSVQGTSDDDDAMEIAECKESDHCFSTILSDIMANCVDDEQLLDAAAVERAVQCMTVTWRTGVPRLLTEPPVHDEVIVGDVPEELSFLSRRLGFLLHSGAVVCAIPLNWQDDRDDTISGSGESVEGPFRKCAPAATSGRPGWDSFQTDLWIAEDGVVYRLLFLRPVQSDSGDVSDQPPEDRDILVAAKVIACGKDHLGFMDMCFINMRVLLKWSQGVSTTMPMLSVRDNDIDEGHVRGPFSSLLCASGGAPQDLSNASDSKRGSASGVDRDPYNVSGSDDDDFASPPYACRSGLGGCSSKRSSSFASRRKLSLGGPKK